MLLTNSQLKNKNKENKDIILNTSKKDNNNNNNLKQKKPLNNSSTWDEQVTQELNKEKINLLQETKKIRIIETKQQEKTCDSIKNYLDVTKTTNTYIMSTNELLMEISTNALSFQGNQRNLS